MLVFRGVYIESPFLLVIGSFLFLGFVSISDAFVVVVVVVQNSCI